MDGSPPTRAPPSTLLSRGASAEPQHLLRSAGLHSRPQLDVGPSAEQWEHQAVRFVPVCPPFPVWSCAPGLACHCLLRADAHAFPEQTAGDGSHQS